MIKAEVITAQGTQAPNRLNQAKAGLLPWTAVLVIILIAVAITVFSERTNNDLGETSQPTDSQSLTVTPASNTATPAEAQAVGLQAPAAARDNTATSLGAANTPALNTADTTNASQNSTATVNPNQLNNPNLTN